MTLKKFPIPGIRRAKRLCHKDFSAVFYIASYKKLFRVCFLLINLFASRQGGFRCFTPTLRIFKNRRTTMKHRIIRFAVIAFLCAAFASPAAAVDFLSAPATTAEVENLNALVEQVYGDIPEPDQKADIALIDKVQEKGSVPVIVRLRDGDLPFGFFADTMAARPEVIRGLQDAVVDDVLAQTPLSEAELNVKRFSIIPGMALLADPETLDVLLANPKVMDIVEDVAVPPALSQSVPLIGADGGGSFGGYTGDGWAVAILDTGVDKAHPFLTGKVVAEACYSSTVTGQSTTVCPGGVEESTAAGSGTYCNLSLNGCDHGTHVAGIAAGRNATFSGVAKDADIIAIQVFSNFGSDVMSWTSDQILGLQRVYALRNTYQIASANMSLGGGSYASYCDTAPQKSAIDTLRAAGIATVIASGNGSATSGISSPGCISSAVSVGSTTKADVVSSYSNSADILALLAPGSSINSSVPGTTYQSWSGTSMATPHVAGAWAVLKEAYPDAGVTEVLTALQETGVLVTDTRSGAANRVKPRIDVAAAVEALSVCATDDDCGGATPLCVSGTCVECEQDDDCDDFCVNNACVECRNAGDCTDGLYCNGVEACSAGVCADRADPCSGGTPHCIEASDRCVECTSSSHCDDGYACQSNICVEDCDLTILYKAPIAEKLKKDKKIKLKVTGDAGFDPYAPVTAGRFTIYKTKPVVKYKKGVLVKNELQVTVIVPAGTPPGSIEVHMTPCSGTIEVQ
ncbi:MAG: hypothetical protein FJ119_12750 [Deltaproteobacteria bacterium]|nr:hypothetical protein [Deltaproteobacteria bacterium]